MKLIIRDDKPKDDTCEIWLDERSNGYVLVMSQIGKGRILTEVILYPEMSIHHPSVTGNFKWEDK